MSNLYNDVLIEEIKTKDLIIVENGNIFRFSTKEEEKKYIENLKYDFAKHYIIEGEKEIIINLDYDILKPYVRYCLKDVYKSLEYKGIIFNRIIIFINTFFILLIIFLLIGVRGGITKLLENQQTLWTEGNNKNNINQELIEKIKDRQNNVMSTGSVNNINKIPEISKDNRGNGNGQGLYPLKG